MHIPDGFLSNEVAVAVAIPAIAAVGYGLRPSRDCAAVLGAQGFVARSSA